MKTHYNSDSWIRFGINAACPIIGTLLGMLVGHCAGNIYIGSVIGLVFGTGVGLGASVTREYDGQQFHGHWCWMDILFDCLGLVTGSGIMALVIWLCCR